MNLTPEQEADLSRQRATGGRARGILDDPLFRDAVETVRTDCRRTFEKSALDDDRGRLVARLKVDALEDVITALAKHVRRGIMAADDLSIWEKFKERMAKRKAA